MTPIRLYVEGGGATSHGKAEIKRGFGEFLGELRDLARRQGLRWDVIACGSREATYDAFSVARRKHPDALNVLLVDAEREVSAGSPREHLSQNPDGWDLRGIAQEQAFLMVQAVEAWLIADVDALAAFYGQGFNSRALPRRPDPERIPKGELEPALVAATRRSRKGKYHKTNHCGKLLERADPAKVRARCPHCAALFDTLRAPLGQAPGGAS